MPDMSPDWSPFIAKTSGQPPKPNYLNAVERFSTTGDAVDLGFGAGNEVLDLLERGWRVHAIDSDPTAVTTLRDRASGWLTVDDPPLRVTQAELDGDDLGSVDFIHAQSSLFFTGPDRFDAVWRSIRTALRPGGRFAGNLLGPRDSWADTDSVVVHTRVEVDELLSGLEVEHFAEQDEDGKTMMGEKHWHAYYLIVRKPA